MTRTALRFFGRGASRLGLRDTAAEPRRGAALLGLVLALAGCDAESIVRGTTRIGNTTDSRGPYPVLTQIDDADGVDQVWLHVRAGKTGDAPLTMTEVDPGIFRAEIPGQPPYTQVRYFVEARDGDQRVADPPDALQSEKSRFSFWVNGLPCQQDLECGSGEHCDEQHRCRTKAGGCAGDADCGNGLRCGPLGTCLLAVRPCVHDEGCLLGEVCDRLLGECGPRPRCDQGLSCPLEMRCDSDRQFCLRACMGPADCGPGEVCKGSVCSGAQACPSSSACPGGLACDPILKICRPEGAGLCAACQRDADCGGPADYCLLLGNGQFCGRDCQAGGCPAGYTCNKSLSPPQCQPEKGTCRP